MANEIRITPAQLREIADQITTKAGQIEQQVTETSRVINLMVNGGYFKGHLSTEMMSRYEQTRGTMETWPGYFNQFADSLRTAADDFTRIDQEQQGPTCDVPPDPNDPANMSDEALNGSVNQLRESLHDSWKTVGASISTLGFEGVSLAAKIVAALASGGSLTALAIEGVAEAGIAGLETVPGLQKALQTLATDSEQYIELAGIQAERSMHFSFDTPAELDQQRQVWQTMLDDRVNNRLEIYQNWDGEDASAGERILDAVIPLRRPISMAVTFDSYWDIWTSNEMQIYQAQAQLHAIDLRQQQL